ncbi:hypothetical protein D6764_04790 [Candidatus Woesearchaeota archaeon]|nr:MAG: hypothetical protein D6764_04790 [Candidatus Woesearchaeota archaeon]
MGKPEVISEEPMNMVEVKAELSKIKKRDEELNFRANKTEEYLQQLHLPSKAKAKELYEKLVALEIPRMKDVHIHKIIDILPRTVQDLKVVLQGYTLTVKQDNQKKIVDVINEVMG